MGRRIQAQAVGGPVTTQNLVKQPINYEKTVSYLYLSVWGLDGARDGRGGGGREQGTTLKIDVARFDDATAIAETSGYPVPNTEGRRARLLLPSPALCTSNVGWNMLNDMHRVLY